jgi:hypothetical protein
MSTFKELIQKKSSENKGLLGLEALNKMDLMRGISSNLISSEVLFGQSEKAKFSSEVAKIVAGDEFINELSIKIGKPKINESENEFVDRAKKLLRELLKSKVLK